MEQSKMNKKFVKVLGVMIAAIFLMRVGGYAGSAMWAESKFLSIVAYALIPVVGYLAVRTMKKINDE